MSFRRVVTSVENHCESDDILEPTVRYEDGHILTEIWTTSHAVPNLEDKYKPKQFTLDLGPGHTRFVSCIIPPLSTIKSYEIARSGIFNEPQHGMHSTQTIDYILVLRGQVDLLLKNDKKCLKQGDIVIQRGAEHAWHNNSESNCEIIAVMIGANESKNFTKTVFTQEIKDEDKHGRV